MKNRFDLENDINALWSSASDLKTVTEMMYDSDFIYNSDRTFNVLYGLAEVMEAKLGRLEDTFNQVFELNQYASEEAKELREKIMGSYNSYAKASQELETEQKWNDYFDQIDSTEWPERDEGM
jgi:hypothetical protein